MRNTNHYRAKNLCILLLCMILMLATGIQAQAYTKKTMYVNQKVNLSIPSKYKNVSLKWKSANKYIATVGKKGNVWAKKRGSVYIYAYKGSRKTLTYRIYVKPAVKTITLSKKSLTFKKKGDSYRIKYTLKPSGTIKTVTWKSSNKNVATVDSNGKVVAVGNGTCKITATASGGYRKTATANVTVNIDTAEIVIPQPDTEPETEPVTEPVTEPSTEVTDNPVETETNTEQVIIVPDPPQTEEPETKPQTEPQTEAPELPQTEETEYHEPQPEIIPVSSVSIDDSVIAVRYNIGDTVKLTADVRPQNATDKTVTWSSSDTAIVTVDQNGLVKMVGAGYGYITASTANGKNATVPFWVKATTTRISSITIMEYDAGKLNDAKLITGTDAIKAKNLGIGEVKKILVNTTYGSTQGNTELVYESSDPDIATIDQNGNLTGIRKGYVAITVKTKYPSLKGEYFSASTTYHVGEYTEQEILNGMKID